jgi:hypothetical protein
MSVEQAKRELDFIREFSDCVENMIRFAKQWEEMDASEIAKSNTGDVNAVARNDGYKPAYDKAHAEVSIRMVRINELCQRYGVALPENLLFARPTAFRNIDTHYRYAFPEVAEEQLRRTLLMLRGAADRHLKEEAEKEFEERNQPPIPLRIRAWNAFKRSVRLLHDTGYLKPVVLTLLIVIVIGCLHLFGFDLKTILEIVKVIPH